MQKRRLTVIEGLRRPEAGEFVERNGVDFRQKRENAEEDWQFPECDKISEGTVDIYHIEQMPLGK